MAGVDQASDTTLGAAVSKTGDNNLDPSSMAKNILLSGLGEEGRTPRATSRSLDHGST